MTNPFMRTLDYMSLDDLRKRKYKEDWQIDYKAKGLVDWPGQPAATIIRAGEATNSYIGYFVNCPTARWYAAGDDAKLRILAALSAQAEIMK